jgi:hypothetical protein
MTLTAGMASFAEDRIMNTWRSDFKNTYVQYTTGSRRRRYRAMEQTKEGKWIGFYEEQDEMYAM